MFCVSLGDFGFVLGPKFVLLGLFFLVLRQEIVREQHFRNYLFCITWNVKPYSVEAISHVVTCVLCVYRCIPIYCHHCHPVVSLSRNAVLMVAE